MLIAGPTASGKSALALDLAQMHGGTVSCHSAGLGRGATFTIRLPRWYPASAPSTVALNAARTLDRVLIVDDRQDMLANLKEVAQTLGYHVETAGSAPQASNNLAVSQYDVVLVDLDMPVKNGRELASEIRRSDGPNSGTCLVAISAGGLSTSCTG